MKRYAKTRIKEPVGPKVEKVELSEKNIWPRAIAAGVLLLAGGLTLAFSLKKLVDKADGWQEITVGNTTQANVSGEFTFSYDLGTGGASARSEYREISQLYTQACVDAYQYFGANETGGELANLYDLNAKPNTIVEVSKPLYDALSLLETREIRYHYLSPIYVYYYNLCTSESDADAMEYDPHFNEMVMEECAQWAAYAANSESVDIELLGENKVRLNVSDEYMDFAATYGFDHLVDLSYMKNAFVIDYIADLLLENGYTKGCITSYDGYTRYLDYANDDIYSYTYGIYDRYDDFAGKIAVGQIAGMSASVVLKDFAVADLEQFRYYKYSDGTVRSPYLSFEDGTDHAALPFVFVASEKAGCAETVLTMLPVYINDSYTEQDLYAFEQSKIYALYCVRGKVFTNIPDTTFKTGEN